MGLLARVAASTLAALAFAACYQPTLRDCTVSCTSASDCAGDQVCDTSGWCAAPGMACSSELDAAGPDGAADDDATADGPIATDASSDATIDAGATLRIVISGRGSVAGDFPGIDCNAPPGDCSYAVPPGADIILTAVDGPGSHDFVDWTTPNCMGMGRTCTLTVTAPVTLVGVTFD